MLYYERGGEKETLSDQDLKEGLYNALDRLGPRRKVLVIPPDFTRFHSRAGVLTRFAWQYYGDSLSAILPALGTHSTMTAEQMGTMFGDTPPELFRVHDWRSGLSTLGEVPADFVREVSEGKLDFSWPAQVMQQIISIC